jgi:hypothetical protein
MNTEHPDKTIQGFNARSIGVRVFILKNLLEPLSSVRRQMVWDIFDI